MEKQVINLTTPKPEKKEGLLKKGWKAIKATFGWIKNKLTDMLS